MDTIVDLTPDVMQVCRNGHVITDLLLTHSERARSHCDRCGATTLSQCATCGQPLPGAIFVPGLEPVGVRRPPDYCSHCGAAFPWAPRRPAETGSNLDRLELLLRRLPQVARELRVRHGNQPPFRLEGERDLEDLVRALLPIHCDDIRPESRTPYYSLLTRTDFLLPQVGAALATKLVQRGFPTDRLLDDFREDFAYYQSRGCCRILVGYVHDPEGLVGEPDRFETACRGLGDDLEVRCVVGRPLAA